MNIFHTIVIKVSSVVTAMLLFVGVGTPQTTVVDVQNNGVTISTATSTVTEVPQAPLVAIQNPVTPQIQTVEPTPVPVTQPVAEVPVVTAPVVTQPQVVTQQPTATPYVPVIIIQQPQTAPQETVQPVVVASKPMELAKIEIKNPIGLKGLGRDLKYRAEPKDELNEIFIGAVLYNPDGSVNQTERMTVTATDSSQDKILEGTGNMSTFGDINNPKFYYPFTYQFKTPGVHKITFSALGVTEEVSVNVTEEDLR